jgi:DNA-binding NtrC family response regulator/CHASE2 domain-containing sensor protein
VRDPASEARFGAGSWDRAVLARLITHLAGSGAAAIGFDVSLGQLSAPARGGASSDALLSQATALADAVVYPLSLELAGARASEGGDAPMGRVDPVLLGHRSWLPSSQVPSTFLEARPLGAPLPGLAQHARGVGHTLAPADPDGVVRKVPLFVRLGDRAVPAFGVALAAAFMNAGLDQIVIEGGSALIPRPGSIGGAVVLPAGSGSNALVLRPGSGRPGPARIPIDERGRALVNYATADLPQGFRVVPFLDVWAAIEERQAEKLRSMVDAKLVLVLAEAASAQTPTPLGPMSEIVIQAHLLNTLLTGSGLSQVPLTWMVFGTVFLSALAAWLWLVLPWWRALVGVVLLAAAYAGSLLVLLTQAGIVLPMWLPFSALTVVSMGALLWNHLVSTRRIRHLEDEIGRVQRELTGAQEALVHQESSVEALEEDLESARTAIARSTGAEHELVRAADTLRGELADARALEEQRRRRLQELEDELRRLRLGDSRPPRPGESPQLRPGDTRRLRVGDSRQGQLGDAEQERLRQECERIGIITRDPVVLAVFRDLEKAARSSLPIVLLGEPGTGKELFARAVHQLGPRADQAFVAVNMAAIPLELFESELFGHVKGSFTGSVGDRKGYFELADRGTIFLDEIGELRLEYQSKLLRVLQEKSFYRVGATRPTTVDVRVVAASNQDLERAVAEGRFREDLYFRLKGLVLRLPPLRERREDLPLLAARFVEEAVAELGRPVMTLSEEAFRALEGHAWIGNIRELQHCLRQAVALAEGPLITREALRLAETDRTRSLTEGGASLAPDAVDLGTDAARHSVDAAGDRVDASGDRVDASGDGVVLARLRHRGFDMQAAARDLGWDRSTVTQRLKGLAFRALVESGGDRAKAALALARDPALSRTVELKLRDYYEHLLRAVQGFDSPDAAIDACRRRFKNLPERHFTSLEILVRQHFERRPPTRAS